MRKNASVPVAASPEIPAFVFFYFAATVFTPDDAIGVKESFFTTGMDPTIGLVNSHVHIARHPANRTWGRVDVADLRQLSAG
jgi:hypothetical protein